MSSVIRVWCIGSDGTEYFAAHSEEEVRAYYAGMVGEEQATRDFAAHFEEVPNSAMDKEFDFDEDGTTIQTTWRKLSEGIDLPAQISTSYF